MSPVSLTEERVFGIIKLPGGAVAQLGEYVTGSHGVAGSSPVSSTIKFFFKPAPKIEATPVSCFSEKLTGNYGSRICPDKL